MLVVATGNVNCRLTKTKNIATIRTLLHDDEQANGTDIPPALALALAKEATAEQFISQSIASTIGSNDIDAPQSLDNLVVAVCSSMTIRADPIVSAVVKSKAKESVAELMKRITGIDIELCKHCKIGRLEKIPLPPYINQAPAKWDTS